MRSQNKTRLREPAETTWQPPILSVGPDEAGKLPVGPTLMALISTQNHRKKKVT